MCKEKMDVETVTALFNSKKQSHDISFDPKLEQMQIAAHLMNGRNTIGLLPTGFGKTLCFVVKEMLSEDPGITLIISPLLSLMDDQMKALSRWKFSCAKIAHDTPSEICKGIAEGNYQFVFGSPESVLKPHWRSVFLSSKWQRRMSCLVFDEAHCLSEWGEDFRPDYKEMAQLRSFFNGPVLVVTATCTMKVKDDILSILQLFPNNTEIVDRSPDRDNICISCRKRTTTDLETEFDWLIQHIKVYGTKAKKIIIYCRSIDTVSELFLSLKCSLGVDAYSESKVDSNNLLIEMYHKCTHDSSKARILKSFSKKDSVIRCVIATVALGMGIDIPDVDVVIHYGCPKSVVSYWQEAGRCARDGRQGLSLIIYDNFTASLKTTDKSIASIVRNSEAHCIRQSVMDIFTAKVIISNTKCIGCQDDVCKCKSCRCCSFCSSTCPCPKKTVSANSFRLLD